MSSDGISAGVAVHAKKMKELDFVFFFSFF